MFYIAKISLQASFTHPQLNSNRNATFMKTCQKLNLSANFQISFSIFLEYSAALGRRSHAYKRQSESCIRKLLLFESPYSLPAVQPQNAKISIRECPFWKVLREGTFGEGHHSLMIERQMSVSAPLISASRSYSIAYYIRDEIVTRRAFSMNRVPGSSILVRFRYIVAHSRHGCR